MSNYGITVDTGGAAARSVRDVDLAVFWRNAGLVQSALENMKGGMRSIRSGIQGATHCFTQMGSSAQGVLSTLMNTSDVVQGLRAGMKNLYRWSQTWGESFAGTLDGLASNAMYLKNSLAAMAAPLLEALSPAIEYVTDRFVGLFNLINQFFARLTGASTYVAAKRVSGSFDSVGSSAGNATEEVKELERQLADFDDLNVLSAYDVGTDSGSVSGSGASGEGVMFEQRQIESGLAGFVDSLKQAFLEGDWQELGTLIGVKINELVEDVDWAAAGARVGYYVNGLFSTAYWTLEAVNFKNIGASAAEFLNNALAEIDFSNVGATIALLFTSLAETVAGFIEAFDWAQFAGKLADGLNGFAVKLGEKLDAIDWTALALRLTEGLNAFIAGTDWANVGAVFAGRINDLLAILGTAAANFNWKDAGSSLATAVNNLFKKIDWDALGAWLNDTLQGVLDFGIAFFQGFDARRFAEDVNRALAKVDWDSVAQKLWELFKLALKKLGEFVGTLLFGGSADLKLNLALIKDGWDTLSKWLGIDKPLSALIGLLRNNWKAIADWLGIGAPLSALIGLTKNGWTSIQDFVGGLVEVSAKLLGKPAEGSQTLTGIFGASFDTRSNLKGKVKDSNALRDVYPDFDTRSNLKGRVKDSNSLTDVYGNFDTRSNLKGRVKDSNKLTDVYGDFDTHSNLKGRVDGSKKLKDVYGEKFDTKSNLTGKERKSKSLTDVYGKTFTVTATLSENISGLTKFVETIASKLKDALQKIWNSFSSKANGGIITNGGREMSFASGGVIRGGTARYLANVPHYAGGTTRAHGTVFVAGESGPEIMGHINGRTEILNRSQLAQTMYSAVASAMGQAVSALGTFLSGQLAECTNAITTTVGNLAAIRGLEYHAPVMASGSVLPYEVAAQVARTGVDIQNTLDSNNEDLIQTIISVIGAQTSAIVAALASNQQQGGAAGGLTAQQLINDINRRAQMFGSSPLLE